MSKRYLGVDLGAKRIGLAVGDSDSRVVSPVDVIQARPTAEADARDILAAAEEYGADAIVVGLPLNMDGTEGPQAQLSKSLAEALRELAGPGEHAAGHPGTSGRPMEVFLQDERLSSFAADQHLIGRELTRKKKKARQDALAAAVLLQAFLDRQRE